MLTIETNSIHVVRKFYCTHNKNEKITTANSINPMLMQKSRCLSCAPTVFHPRNGNRCFICPLLVTGRAESIHVAVRARPQDPAPQMAKAVVPPREICAQGATTTHTSQVCTGRRGSARWCMSADSTYKRPPNFRSHTHLAVFRCLL